MLVRRAVERGIDVYDALRAACIVPIEHYGLDVGQLRVGDPADFIEVDSLTEFNVLRTWIDGRLVAERGETTIPRVEPRVVNKFVGGPNQGGRVWRRRLRRVGAAKLQVIEALDGQLITNRWRMRADTLSAARVVSDVERRRVEAGGGESLSKRRSRRSRSSRTSACSAERWPRASPTIRTT